MSFECKSRCEKLIIALKIISKLSKEDKLIFRHRDVIIQKKSMMTSIYRYIFNDSRKDTVDGLMATLDEVGSVMSDIAKVENIMSDVEKYSMMKRLSYSLHNTISKAGYGINSLKIIYQDDPVIIANLEAITERTKLLERDLSKRLSSFKNISIDSETETEVGDP